MKISPIFYMGNKKKLINKGLIELFPKDIHTFYDLFGGSGIVSMNTNAQSYVIADKDGNLVSLYDMFTFYEPDEIISAIENLIDKYNLPREGTKRNVYSDKQKIEQYKRAYHNLRDYYNTFRLQTIEETDTHDFTIVFYTLCFFSFSQQFRFNSKGQFNMPFGNNYFTEKNKEYIRNGCDFFGGDNVVTLWGEFEEIYHLHDNAKAIHSKDFFYFDPPYSITTSTYTENRNGEKGWDSSDDLRLFNLCDELNTKGIKFAMSNVFECKGKVNTPLIEWANKYNVHHFTEHTYSACGKGNSKADEVLIMNY